MKRAAYLLAVANLLLGLFIVVACGQQGPQLLRTSDHPQQDSAKTDLQAIQNWWRDLHGDADGKPRILEVTQPMKLRDFEVDIGDRSRPHWVNCESWLQGEGTGAHAIKAKVGPPGTNSLKAMLFVIKDGEVIYQKHAFRAVR